MKTDEHIMPHIIPSWQMLKCQNQTTQPKINREPVVAGSFYPSDAEKLETQLQQHFQANEDHNYDKDIAAIIVPHAGYIFSGEVAASAYGKIDPQKSFTRIFIIGSSHHMNLNGASVYHQGNYKTPLGMVPVDTDVANSLIRENELFDYVPEVHINEHTIEVQLPFLQYHMQKPFMIVPIIIGTQSGETCKELSGILAPYFTPENLFVISSDFSHYPTYADAIKIDQKTAEAVLTNSTETFMETIKRNKQKQVSGLATSCCGWTSVLTLLNIISLQQDIEVEHIRYMNSGDTIYGDHNRVVGYHSFSFSRTKTTQDKFELTQDDKVTLLKIARESINASFESTSYPEIDESSVSDHLKTHCGAFVSLSANHKLRGCIGRFAPEKPLFKIVQELARAAAFNDYRFTSVTKAEMNSVNIEISVLTPLKKINSADDLILGTHGIYMVKGPYSGTFLPKVAESKGWNKEEFLGHCAKFKAGIGWDGWKDADLYTYEALVFDEEEMIP